MQGLHDGEFPFLKVSDMNLAGNERTISTWNHTVSDVVRRQLRAKAFPSGTVIFPKVGAAIATNKKRVLTKPSCVDNNVMAVVPNPQNLDSTYLYFLLLSKNLSELASASNPPSIRKSDVEAWHVRIPPLPEQRRIVDVLSRAEGLVRRHREAVTKARDIIPALFLHLFGDPASNPKGWTIQALGELLVGSPQNGIYKHVSDYGSGTPILRIDAFYDGLVTNLASLRRLRLSEDECRRYALNTNDIVVNRVNSPEYLGKSAIVPPLSEPVVFESNMMRLTLDNRRVDPAFVIEHLQSQHTRSQIAAKAKHAINQSSINQGDVKGFTMIVPPLPLQTQFAEQVIRLRRLQQQAEAALQTAEATFASLLHRAFTGDL